MTNRRALSPLLAATLVAALPSTASAEGLSTDMQLVRPTFSTGSLSWADSPIVEKDTLRVGLHYMWEQNPVIYYLYENYQGPIIGQRQAVALGVNYDITEQISARLVLPGAINGASEVPELSADGFGLADPNIGARFEIVQVGPLTVGTRADIYLPFGAKNAYLGEDRLRAGAGLLLRANIIDRVFLNLDTNVLGRPSVETAQDFVLGSEIALNPGVSVAIWPELVEVNTGLTARGGFANLAQGGGENSMEALAGVRFWPESFLQVDIGYGKGITDGYGTTFNRVYGGLTYIRQPPPPAPVIVDVEVEPPPQVTIVELEPEKEEPDWEEGELAKIDMERIVIRDPIQFEVDTPNILPESFPTLQFVANLLSRNAQLVHVVIEGHASEEGDYDYNYDLSVRRAKAIWERLLLNGVAPSRISYRAMGEVAPVAEGEDEATLAASRRVVFYIAKQIDVLEEPPEYETETRIPWTGEPLKLQRPTQNMPDELIKDMTGTESEKNYIDPSQFLEGGEEDEFEMDGAHQGDEATDEGGEDAGKSSEDKAGGAVPEAGGDEGGGDKSEGDEASDDEQAASGEKGEEAASQESEGDRKEDSKGSDGAGDGDGATPDENPESGDGE
jgi:outer membrane protein OmpA-like peptidoglycan-associated protein